MVLAGLVVELRTRNTQSGARMAFVTLDDRSARMEIRVFSKVFEQYRALLAIDKMLVVQGTLAFDDFSGSMRLNAERIYEIDQAREVYAKRLVLEVGEVKAGNDLFDLRAKHPDFVFFGWLEKESVNEGNEDTIEPEIMGKVPRLLEHGRYFPNGDHGLQPLITFPNLCRFMTLLHEVCGNPEGEFPRVPMGQVAERVR